VEKLKERYSGKECHLRNLICEVEQLTVQQQKLQQELNARVVSVGLLSGDVNRLTDEISVYLLNFLCIQCHISGQANKPFVFQVSS